MMKIINGTVHLEPGERAVVVDDHGFMIGIVAVIVYRHHRLRVYHRPSESSVRRIRRLFKALGDFACFRGSGPTGPKGAKPYIHDYWVHPAPWGMFEPAAVEGGEGAQEIDGAQG